MYMELNPSWTFCTPECLDGGESLFGQHRVGLVSLRADSPSPRVSAGLISARVRSCGGSPLQTRQSSFRWEAKKSKSESNPHCKAFHFIRQWGREPVKEVRPKTEEGMPFKDLWEACSKTRSLGWFMWTVGFRKISSSLPSLQSNLWCR